MTPPGQVNYSTNISVRHGLPRLLYDYLSTMSVCFFFFGSCGAIDRPSMMPDTTSGNAQCHFTRANSSLLTAVPGQIQDLEYQEVDSIEVWGLRGPHRPPDGFLSSGMLSSTRKTP